MKENGFSLIELIVVVVILGALAALIGPRVTKIGIEGQIEATRSQIALLETALTTFHFDNQRYPTTAEGLEALIENPGLETWDGPYLNKRRLPTDAWRRPFQYLNPGQHEDYDLWSDGPRSDETGDEVTNWE